MSNRGRQNVASLLAKVGVLGVLGTLGCATEVLGVLGMLRRGGRVLGALGMLGRRLAASESHRTAPGWHLGKRGVSW